MQLVLILLTLFFLPSAGAAQDGGNILLAIQEDIHQAIAVCRPSVVGIRAQKRYTAGTKAEGMWYESIGSGFLIDDLGHIVTNNHVIDGAESIDVTIWPANDQKIRATLVRAEKNLDLALLHIKSGGPFTPAMLTDSDQVKIGDWVLSVGSPFGFDHTVTLGMISAIKRDLVIEGRNYDGMIQTDAVINEGNSGGPLVDIQGRVVGVGTAIYAPDGTYTGLGFAIPANRVREFVKDVTGLVAAAFLQPVATTPGKLPIDITKRQPNDAIHKTFSDCTTCHVIATKSVVSTQVPMPHAMVGVCDNCHIMENKPPAGQAVPVAGRGPISGLPQPGGDFFAEFWSHYLPKSILLILSASMAFSMIGVGGGFLYVPILLACGVDFYTASSTSQFMIAAASISALTIYYRSGLVDWRLVLALEIPTMMGAYLGGRMAQMFNISALYILFAICLFVAGYFMLKDKKWLNEKCGYFHLSPFLWLGEFRGNVYQVDILLHIPLTFVVGYFGGVLGVAGGWLKVPILVLMLGIPMKVAVACSSLMVPITGICGFLGHQSQALGHFQPKIALTLALVAAIGGNIGARMAIKSQPNLLRVLFAMIMALVAVWMTFKVVFSGV